MKRIDSYTHKTNDYTNKSSETNSINTNSPNTHQRKYYTIQNADKNGFSSISTNFPTEFRTSFNQHITVLNFEAFYPDPNKPGNIIRSNCTELLSNIGMFTNHDNNIICLSRKGFCGYLYYDVSNLRTQDIRFSFGNPLFENLNPVYVVIQLLLEYF